MLNKIYNEDCLLGIKKIPDNFVDLVIIDPPYSICTKGGKKGNTKIAKNIKALEKELIVNDLEDIIYDLMFYLGRYSVWEELFPSEFSKGLNYPSELSKYEPLISDLYDCLKNNSGELEEYSKIRNLLNSFKAMWVNISSCN